MGEIPLSITIDALTGSNFDIKECKKILKKYMKIRSTSYTHEHIFTGVKEGVTFPYSSDDFIFIEDSYKIKGLAKSEEELEELRKLLKTNNLFEKTRAYALRIKD